MGVKLNMNAKEFFAKLLPQEVYVEYLMLTTEHGVTAEIGFYSVSLGKQGHDTLTINVPISTSSLMKDNGSAEAVNKSSSLLIQLIESGVATFVKGDDAVPQGVKTKSKAASAKAVASPASSETVQSIADALGVDTLKVPSPSAGELDPPAKKVNVLKDVVPLKEAKALGQMTRGTSPSSVYRAVAISYRVNVAARIQGSQLSLRIEGQPNAFEKGKMQALGFSEQSAGVGNLYWSVHMDVGALTPARAVGAVLMDLGVEFEQQAKNLKEVGL